MSARRLFSDLCAVRFNTLFYILQRQRPELSLRICHRLDRLTSGLVILAKTSHRANVIQTQISELLAPLAAPGVLAAHLLFS